MKRLIKAIIAFHVGIFAWFGVGRFLPDTEVWRVVDLAIAVVIFYPIAVDWFPRERQYWLFGATGVALITLLNVLETSATPLVYWVAVVVLLGTAAVVGSERHRKGTLRLW